MEGKVQAYIEPKDASLSNHELRNHSNHECDQVFLMTPSEASGLLERRKLSKIQPACITAGSLIAVGYLMDLEPDRSHYGSHRWSQPLLTVRKSKENCKFTEYDIKIDKCLSNLVTRDLTNKKDPETLKTSTEKYLQTSLRKSSISKTSERYINPRNSTEEWYTMNCMTLNEFDTVEVNPLKETLHSLRNGLVSIKSNVMAKIKNWVTGGTPDTVYVAAKGTIAHDTVVIHQSRTKHVDKVVLSHGPFNGQLNLHIDKDTKNVIRKMLL